MLNSAHQTKVVPLDPARTKLKPNLTYLIWKNIANYNRLFENKYVPKSIMFQNFPHFFIGI
jgi:hypothetical protein